MDHGSWLFLLYSLPTKNTAERVRLWRKLKKFGAIQFKTSSYVLPDEPVHHERFQWLAQNVRDSGGEATLMQVAKIDGITDEQMIGFFNQERSKEYSELTKELNSFITANRKKRSDNFISDLEKLRRKFVEIRAVDFFTCPATQDVEMLLQKAEALFDKKQGKLPRLNAVKYRGKIWLTRPRPEVDRVASAWLIKRFIDPESTFVFAPQPADYPSAIPYDMTDVEFTHHGDDCTFETLLKRFDLSDKALWQISEMVHDADLEDEKFGRHECLGIHKILQGFAKIGLPDEEILHKGFDCFDALYRQLRN